LAFAEVQLIVVLLPAVMLVGLADNVMVGACSANTARRASVGPPLPVQVSRKLELAVMGPTLWVPDSALPPLQLPAAVQLVALVELQVRLTLEPASTWLALALSVTTGAGTDWIMLTVVESELWPPGPVQIIV
jgi:hypothetical protein